jgi:hypothetical protein
MNEATLTWIPGLGEMHRWLEGGERDKRVALTWSNQVLRELETRNVPCLDVMDLLDPESMDDIYRRVIAAADDWWRPQLEGLEYRGVHLGEAMGRDMLYAFLDALGASECMRRAIKQLSPSAVEAVDSGRRPFFWDPPGGPYPDVASAVALWEAEQHGLPARLILELEPHPLPPPRQGGPPGQIPGFKGSGSPKTLFFLAPTDHGRMVPVLQAAFGGRTKSFLLQSGEYNAPEAGTAQLRWNDWLSHFPPNTDLTDRVTRCCSALRQPMNAFQKEMPCLFANPHLDFQWAAYAHRLVLGGRIVDASRHLLETLKPEVCVLGTTTAGTWRAFVQTARGLGIPIASVHHSSLLPEALLCGIWRPEADLLLVEGSLTRCMYERWGKPSSSLVEVGWPAGSLVRSHDVPSETGPILVLPNEWDWGFAVPAFVSRRRNQSLHDVAELALRLQDRSFVLKPHPRTLAHHLAEYHRAAEGAPNFRVAEPSDRLADHLATASVVVFVDSCSQAFSEACLAGLPGVHHRPAILEAWCTKSVQDMGYVPVTRTIGELEVELEALWNDPAHRTEVRAGVARFVREFFHTKKRAEVEENVLSAVAGLAQRGAESVCGS